MNFGLSLWGNLGLFYRYFAKFMDDSVPYKHHIAPHIEDLLKEVVDLVAGVADELSDEELGYLVRNPLVKIVDEQYMS